MANRTDKKRLSVWLPQNTCDNVHNFVKNNVEVRLNPKYILGYIPVSNHHIETIITKEDILKKRRIESNNYSSDTLETTKHR